MSNEFATGNKQNFGRKSHSLHRTFFSAAGQLVTTVNGPPAESCSTGTWIRKPPSLDSAALGPVAPAHAGRSRALVFEDSCASSDSTSWRNSGSARASAARSPCSHSRAAWYRGFNGFAISSSWPASSAQHCSAAVRSWSPALENVYRPRQNPIDSQTRSSFSQM